MRGMASSLFIVALVVIVLSFVAHAAGFEMNILSSLVISLALTLVLNLALGGFRRRSWR